MTQPLSQQLADLLASTGHHGRTFNRLLERTEGRGLFLLIIVLCIPFIVPVSIPGFSTVMGSAIFFLTLPLAFKRSPPRLPAFVGERELPSSIDKILAGGIRFLRVVEKLARPRKTEWLTWPVPHFLNCLLLACLAIVLALPLPSPPFFFSNSMPAYAIILLAAAMMEEDGVLVWVAYAAAVGNVIFFSLIGGVVLKVLLKSWESLVQYIAG